MRVRPGRRLLAWRSGEDGALQRLIPVVEHQLRRLARRATGHERADATLQPTALVNQAYLRLVDLNQVSWIDPAHFFALTARLMRRILVDRARARRSVKRGGLAQAVTLNEEVLQGSARPPNLIALDDALERLARIDPRGCQVVELRFFGG